MSNSTSMTPREAAVELARTLKSAGHQALFAGGCVRDRLLGRTVSEVDWVVVGASAEQMLELGYRPVGADFPVFLHPQSGEELEDHRDNALWLGEKLALDLSALD